MNDIARTHRALAVLRRLMSTVRGLITQRAAHPARTVVLLPYAQLIPLARTLWAAGMPTGFAPRFETTMGVKAAFLTGQGRLVPVE